MFKYEIKYSLGGLEVIHNPQFEADTALDALIALMDIREELEIEESGKSLIRDNYTLEQLINIYEILFRVKIISISKIIEEPIYINKDNEVLTNKKMEEVNEEKYIKIINITDNYIEFSNHKKIGYYHDQECCEYNYADFNQLDDEARQYTYNSKLIFEEAVGGFRFGDKRRMFYVPCYSEQNGYYSDNVAIIYDGKLVLSVTAKVVGDD